MLSYNDEKKYPHLRKIDDCNRISLPQSNLELGIDLDAMVNRQSVRQFSKEKLPVEVFSNILFEATLNIRGAEESKLKGDKFFLLNSFYSWLNIFVVAQGIEDVARGIYQYDPLEHTLTLSQAEFRNKSLTECIQNQFWVGGGGFCTFAVVDWERYMWIYRHSRAYVNLLIQLGEFGQEFLHAMYKVGVGGWMTPAVNESLASDLLGLDADKEDAMYFIKAGYPLSGTGCSFPKHGK